MYFDLVTLNIVPPNAWVKNYWNKSTIIIYLWLFFLSPLSSDKQSYTKFLLLKSTDKNARNVIHKIKSYFSQPAQDARYFTLFYYYENKTALYFKD